MRYFEQSQVEIYLKTLFGDLEEGFIDLRPMNEDNYEQHFYNLEEEGITDDITERIKESSGQYHIFCGINPRGHRAGSEADVSDIVCFWADVDAKDFNGDKEQARQAIRDFPLKPTIIVDSGNGYHAYWKLENKWDMNNENDRLEAKKISASIHTMINADSTFDLGRILRVPGTPNIKDPNNSNRTTSNESNWKPCVLDELNMTCKYDLTEFYNVIPNTTLEQQADNYTIDLEMNTRFSDLEGLQRLLSNNNILERAESIPDRFEGDRSANDFWISAKLFEEGLNDTEVFQAFVIFKDLGWDAGIKFAERGEDYLLDYTLPTAKNSTNKFQEKLNLIANSENKAQASDGIWKIMAQMDSIEQDQAVRKVQEAWGGRNEISLRAIRTKVQQERQRLNANQEKSFFEYNENGTRSFVPAYLAQNIESENAFIFTAETLYFYENGVFKPDGNYSLKNIIQDKLEGDWKKSYSQEVTTYIRERNYIKPVDIPQFNLINTKNGMIDVRNEELKEHSPRYMSTTQMNVKYNPDAECERLEQFMQEVFPEDAIDIMWEHAGYSLLKNLELKKFLILVGKRNAGKSIFLEVLTQVIGEENVANESLQNLANDKYSTSQLFGKVANIYADLDKNAVERVGTIKMLTGGDRIRGEVKYGDTFYFYNSAKLLFSCNQLPPVHDYSEAFFKRLNIVRCPNQFLGDDRDTNLLGKLTTENAKSAFLNKAIEGAQRLIENNGFSNSEHIADEVTRYRLESDSVSEFIHTQTNEVDGCALPKEKAYEAYKEWAEENNRRPVSKTKFTRRAKADPNNLTEYRPTVNGQQVPAWKGLELTEIAQRNFNTTASINIMN